MITNGLTYIAILMFVAGGLLVLQRTTKWKIFDIVPPLVWIYVLHMIICTFGVYESDAVKATYSSFKNNLLYAMIFVMLLRCDFRKLGKLGPRMIAIFLGCSLTLAIGTIAAYPIFMNSLGGGEKTWAAVAALYASWVGGSGNMAAMEAAFTIDPGAYGAALALDTVCYSVWIALLLLAVRYADKWNKACKADTSKLDAIADAANAELAKDKKIATAADWIFLIGISLLISTFTQWAGKIMNNGLCAIGLDMFGAATCTTVLVTILGLICAMTPLGKMAGVEELSSVYLYAVVSMLASRASLVDLIAAPMWVVYGFVILIVHVVLMFILSKLFKWDLCMVSTASLANIGGSASAPIVATAYNPNFAGIGVLMGVLGAAIGNFCGLAMGAILQLFV
ncbi:MAG: DUF819 domain-containing protein [Oscillospiraceae bacterium]|nr:DUF819 domain-containing protein [Oscillospiraceae bacterium]